MRKRSMIVRIVAIVLAAIMIISVAAAAFTVFAAGQEVPVTGQQESNTKWLVILIVLAVLAIVACVVLPMAKKKK